LLLGSFFPSWPCFSTSLWDILLSWRTGSGLPPVRKEGDFFPRVTVVLAVYNGTQFLGRKLENILTLNYPPGLLDVVVVSDGSTDATDEIARSFANHGVRLLRCLMAGKLLA
jgi:cellulose synthase/poly-beta-1,6-N-acetylglucosamine synthase-like glycosyltransferase